MISEIIELDSDLCKSFDNVNLITHYKLIVLR